MSNTLNGLRNLWNDIISEPAHWTKLGLSACLMAFALAGAYEAWLNISLLNDWPVAILWFIFALRLITFFLALAAFWIEQTDGPGTAATAIAVVAFFAGKYFYWLVMFIGLFISINPALTPH
jgi:hypothetical protein